MNKIELFPNKKTSFDLICMGRANIDLYAEPSGTSLRHSDNFTKSVGGSPANIAIGASKQGLRTGFIGKVSDDQLGYYVIDTFAKYGVDTSQIMIDSSGLTMTSVCFAEQRKMNNQILFYRKNASDNFIHPEELSEDYIKDSKAILVTGTSLAVSPCREAIFKAIEIARKYSTTVIFDIDYRQSAWSSKEETTLYLGRAVEKSDIVVGNKEEYAFLNLSKVDEAAEMIAADLFSKDTKIAVFKNGEKGSLTISKQGDKVRTGIYEVNMIKPYGSGDAFISTFLNYLITKLLNGKNQR